MSEVLIQMISGKRNFMNILVTGCKGSIGSHLCRHYTEKKYNVNGISRDDVDITDWEKMQEFFSTSVRSDLDLVIHCAAKNVAKRFEKMSSDSFGQIIDSNIMGTFNLLRCAIPLVVKKGSIIIFSSSAAFSPRIGQSAYAASKAALHGLVRVLAQELLADEKYIFLIAPGFTEIGMSKDLIPESMVQLALEKIPMQRACTVKEIVRTIDYLVVTPYMTGQTIHLNGAYSIQ
jgi:NAD(P)-dependent dehydrogenase (short-subunit alcohol dehydrogenase family)